MLYLAVEFLEVEQKQFLLLLWHYNAKMILTSTALSLMDNLGNFGYYSLSS